MLDGSVFRSGSCEAKQKKSHCRRQRPKKIQKVLDRLIFCSGTLRPKSSGMVPSSYTLKRFFVVVLLFGPLSKSEPHCVRTAPAQFRRLLRSRLEPRTGDKTLNAYLRYRRGLADLQILQFG
mmetsp:Transcript_101497/g.179950  ORF Transcript_101497/g.179950 Transcript_101497/m.179950 type:complete len:122 (-) Transcript_101497:125-490(-)